jgi:hypothetical protein
VFFRFWGQKTMPWRQLSTAFLIVCAAPLLASATDDWRSTLTPMTPGPIGELRPIRAKYHYGWGGITAATGDFRFGRTPDNRLRFDASGGTIGLARKLWRFDVEHTATVDPRSLRPLQVTDVENVRKSYQKTQLTFTSSSVTSFREEREGSTSESKTRTFEFPEVQSINSAYLLLRSQQLANGSTYRFVVYPATSAYLCTVTVRGRETVNSPIGRRQAIKMDLQLQKIDKDLQLQAHKKFRRGSIWISDDTDRLVLRIETQVFIGKVFAELQSVAPDVAQQ